MKNEGGWMAGEQRAGRSSKPAAARWLLALARVYFTFLFGLAALRLIFGDHWWWLFALNALTLYWFLPLPVMLVIALILRRRELWIETGLGMALCAFLYGGLFLPRLPKPKAAGPTLTVMTYNLLGSNTYSAGIVEALAASQADVIGLQELNPANAAAIARELAAVYPYQVLDPQEDVTGSGVISRYPMQPVSEPLPGVWVGTPHVLSLEVGSQTVTLVRFHAFAGINNAPGREQQAQILADFARQHGGPFIIMGDLNATDMNRAYHLITRQLRDCWREAGWSFGHTFPGAADTPSSMRPQIAGVPVPQWLVRIDFVFHSDALTALSARTGPWDGASDHRPVMAELALKP
jgi:vancomycin resistance protein VanJ